jgi:hypothetical protein
MWIKVTAMCFIENAEIIEAGISLNNDQHIQEFFVETGGIYAYEDHTLNFEIVDRTNNC